MKNINQIPFTTLFAFGSFAIGTIFFLSYMKYQNEIILVFGFYYVLAAIFFNLIMLVNTINQFLINSDNPLDIFIRIIILLTNIPITVLYLYLVLKSFNNSQTF